MTEDVILNHIKQLPEHLKKEVLDFIGYLESKYPEKKKNTAQKRVFGSAKGKYIISSDFEEPLEDFEEYS